MQTEERACLAAINSHTKVVRWRGDLVQVAWHVNLAGLLWACNCRDQGAGIGCGTRVHFHPAPNRCAA